MAKIPTSKSATAPAPPQPARRRQERIGPAAAGRRAADGTTGGGEGAGSVGSASAAVAAAGPVAPVARIPAASGDPVGAAAEALSETGDGDAAPAFGPALSVTG